MNIRQVKTKKVCVMVGYIFIAVISVNLISSKITICVISRTHVMHKVRNKVLQPILLESTRFISIGSPVLHCH